MYRIRLSKAGHIATQLHCSELYHRHQSGELHFFIAHRREFPGPKKIGHRPIITCAEQKYSKLIK